MVDQPHEAEALGDRHDVARRIDCHFLARLVSEHRMDEDEAFELARQLTVDLVKKAYKL